jgi:adenosylmethionine-8-amino-7-oxononanoate aminotransferase
LYRALFEQGVIFYKSVGMADTDGDGLIVAPPFIITEEQIDLVVDKLRRAVDTILGS